MLARFIKYLLKLATLSVVLFVFFFVILKVVLSLPYVQNILRPYATRFLSAELGSRVEVEYVDIYFPAKIELENLKVYDRKSQLLLGSSSVFVSSLDISFWEYVFGTDTNSVEISVSHISLKNPVLHLYRSRSDSIWNVSFLFKSKKKKKKKLPLHIHFENIVISDLRFFLEDSLASDSVLQVRDTTRVNFKRLQVENLNLEGSFALEPGAFLRANIEEFRLEEKISGFAIEKLTLIFQAPLQWDSLKSRDVVVEKLYLKTKNDEIDANARFFNTSLGRLLSKKGHKKFTAYFNRSILDFGSIGYFLKNKFPLRGKAVFFGEVSGDKRKLKSPYIYIDYAKNIHLEGRVLLRNYTSGNKIFMDIQVRNSRADLQEITELLPYVKFPKFFKKHYVVKLDGKYTGFPKDFVLKTRLETLHGERLETNINLKLLSAPKYLAYSGRVGSYRLNVDSLFGVKYTTRLTSNIFAVGEGVSVQHLKLPQAKIGVLASQLLGFRVDSVIAEMSFSGKIFSGKLFSRSELGDLEARFSTKSEGKKIYTFQGTAKKFRIKKEWSKWDSDFLLSNYFLGTLAGDSLHALTGSIGFYDNKIVNSKNGEKIHIREIQASIQEDKRRDLRKISINSSVADIILKGKYSYGFFGKAIKNFVNTLKYQYGVQDTFSDRHFREVGYFLLDILFKETEGISRLLDNKYYVASASTLRFFYQTDNSVLHTTELEMNSDSVKLPLLEFSRLHGHVAFVSDTINIRMFSQEAEITETIIRKNKLLRFTNISNTLEGERGNMSFLLSFSHDTSLTRVKVFGDAQVDTKKWLVKINQENDFDFFGRHWDLNKDIRILYFKEADEFQVSNFEFVSDTSRLSFVWEDKAPPYMSLRFSRVPLHTIFFLVPRIKREELSGVINLTLGIPRKQKFFVFTTTGKINNIRFRGNRYGDLQVQSYFSEEMKRVNVNAQLSLTKEQHLHFAGYYDLKNSEEALFFTINTRKIPAKWLAPVFEGTVYNIEGELNIRDLAVRGNFSEPILQGSVVLKNISLKTYLFQVKYTLNGKLNFEKEKIRIPNMVLTDEFGKQAEVFGEIQHSFFSDFYFDLSFSTTEHFFVMNTTKQDNEVFYGKLFVEQGEGAIYGTLNLLYVEGRIRASAGTILNISVSYYEREERPSYIHFISKEKEVEEFKVKTDIEGINLQMEVEATKDAELRVIFDERLGDMIVVQGTGSFLLQMTPIGEIKLYGDYSIEEGYYNFTLQNFFTKRFGIDKGSHLKWTGNPYDAKIDITAVYSTITSLQAFDSTATQSIPVNVLLFMKGSLQAPKLTFGLDFPNISYSGASIVLSQLQNIQNDEQELNKQVFSLLVFGTFAPITGFSSGYATTGVVTNLSEFLSGQFNQLLGDQLGDKIRFNLRTNQLNDVSLSFYAKLFGNRVILERQGVLTNNNTGQQRVSLGNIRIQIRLLPSKQTKTGKGELVAVIFNRENWTLGSTLSSVSRGAGLFYKRDFDRISDFFNSKKVKKLK